MNTTTPDGPVERIVGRNSETCDMEIDDGVFGFRKCANKPAPGDVLCKHHRALAERYGYEPARIVGSTPPNAALRGADLTASGNTEAPGSASS